MKLWHVAQWGNVEDGGNGPDTQCIVSASDLKSATTKAELHFSQMYKPFKEGKADVAYLIGDDGRPEGEPQLVVRVWVDHAMNLLHNPAWYRKYWEGDGNEWGSQEEVYGD